MIDWRKAGATTLGATLAAPMSVAACPLCKDAIAGDPVASALSWTTLLLIALPAVLVGAIGGWVWYVYWRATRHDWLASADPPVQLRGGVCGPIWREEESET